MSRRDGDPDLSPAADDAALSGRLRDLERRLDEHRSAAGDSMPDERPRQPGMAMAMRLAADFVGGVVVGGALGWGFDRLFDTSPWGLVVFVLFGFAAGLLTVMRTAGLIQPRNSGVIDGRD